MHKKPEGKIHNSGIRERGGVKRRGDLEGVEWTGQDETPVQGGTYVLAVSDAQAVFVTV